MEVVVADAGDGRFVPQLEIEVTVTDDGLALFTHPVPFLWHPFLYHYGIDAEVPGNGPFDVTVRIAAPSFMRHDPVNGRRYVDPVDVVFSQVRFNTGVKPSSEAEPRGPAAPAARASE
jgi:hypothetical protein